MTAAATRITRRAPTDDREERDRLLAEHKRLAESERQADHDLHWRRERACREAERLLEPRVERWVREDAKKRLAAELAQERALVEALDAAKRAERAAWHAWERASGMCPCEPCYWQALMSGASHAPVAGRSAMPRLAADGSCASCDAGHKGQPCTPCECPGCVLESAG